PFAPHGARATCCVRWIPISRTACGKRARAGPAWPSAHSTLEEHVVAPKRYEHGVHVLVVGACSVDELTEGPVEALLEAPGREAGVAEHKALARRAVVQRLGDRQEIEPAQVGVDTR